MADVIKGVSLEQARVPRRVPSWDLFLVLASLREAPFEPLGTADFSFLTYKTVFLVALALGRRSSELASISGLPGDVSREPDGSISLLFLPEFLAKNQNPCDPSPTLFVRPMSLIIDPSEPDCLNCPVRALKIYRERTKPRRLETQRALFLSINPNRQRDITRTTLARWVALTIKLAYATFGGEKRGRRDAPLPLLQPKAHEVRAWATSLAAKHTTSMPDLLKAAYWRSPDVFISHYLRDISREREDGTFGVSNLVAAQVVLSSARH